MQESRLDHLECSGSGERVAPDRLVNLSPGGHPYLARYRLDGGVARPDGDPGLGMWRYAALLPHRGEAVSLGEGSTPMLEASRLGAALGLSSLWIKDESQNPTASFKSRGLSAAVTMAKALGAKHLAIPTAGNAGGALAAYGARAGLPVDVYMPEDTPEPFALEAELHGATVHKVKGLITDCGALVGQGAADGRWFDVSTLKEPYRVEGKKTMGYEILEQLGELPEVILYPTGGGTGLIGMWKAFAELEQLGWHDGPKPRLVAVQTEGCAPIVRAMAEGTERARPWENAHTLAYGLRVPKAVGDALMLAALRESGGRAIAVPEPEMLDGMREMCTLSGVPAGPESGALVAAARLLREEGWLDTSTKTLLLSTGSAHKYPDGARAALYD